MTTATAGPRTLGRRDLLAGSLIAVLLATGFIVRSPGLTLIVTFLPGLIVATAIFLWLHARQVALPPSSEFIPLFFLTLGVQFLHFAEEYLTGFATRFPALYGGESIPLDTFVVFNMVAYAVFSWSCLLVFQRNLGFLLVPVLFFVTYGAMGNAVSHTWWSLYLGEYFPGLITALVYWALGPLVLSKLMGSRQHAIAVVGILIAVLLTTLTAFMTSPPSA